LKKFPQGFLQAGVITSVVGWFLILKSYLRLRNVIINGSVVHNSVFLFGEPKNKNTPTFTKQWFKDSKEDDKEFARSIPDSYAVWVGWGFVILGSILSCGVSLINYITTTIFVSVVLLFFVFCKNRLCSIVLMLIAFIFLILRLQGI
jgi:hypothetical protein